MVADTSKLKERLAKLDEERNTILLSLGDKERRDYLAEKLQDIESMQREKEITELLNASYTILKTRDFKRTAKFIFDACARSIGARAGYVALLSDDGSENELLFLEDGGMPCTVNPELPMPIRGLREQSYKTGKVVYDNDFMKSEWVKYMPAGHMDLANVLFSPLNIEGKTVGIMGMACKEGDFTEHDARIASAFGEYAAIALQNSRNLEELKKMNTTKDKFFSIISHDLLSPFSSLLGLSDLLIEKINANDVQKAEIYAQSINKSVENIYNLLTQLLEWARLRRGAIEYDPSKIKLRDELKSIVSPLMDNVRAKKLSVDIGIQEDLYLYADQKMLHSILRNLIGNAIKFSYEGGLISVKANTEDDKVRISVTDEGLGLDMNDLKKLFRIDQSISRPGTKNEKGSGLGLILCKEFVDAHQGDIGVESTEGKGSSFWFTLPGV